MKQKLKQLLSKEMFINLSSVNLDGAPETRAMINLQHKEIAPHLQDFFAKAQPGEIYFITNTSSAKMAQIAKNNKTSVYLYDAQTYEGILLLGAVAEVKDQKIKDTFWVDDWKVYYPAGKDGGDFSILKFTGKNYKFYTGQFKVESGKI